MHELKLNITDNVFKEFMAFVNVLPKGSIEIEELNNSSSNIKNSKINSQSFIDEKSRIQHELKSIDNGAVMINDNDFWASTEKVINDKA
jgi:hypothetical protein